MLPNHPFINQEARRQVSGEMSQLRSRLFKAGKEIERKLYQAQKQFDDTGSESARIELALQVGAALAYADMRKSMTPQIGTDGLTQQLRGKASKIKKEILSIE